MELTLASVSMDGDVPLRAVKGKGVPHYARAMPPVLGSVDVSGLCGQSLGRTSDARILLGDEVPDGRVCKRCASVWERLSAAVSAEERADVPDVPAAPVVASAGRLREMQAAVAAYYAAGYPVPEEIRTLPDPRVSGEGWRGAGGGRGKGAVCVHPEADEPVKVKHKVAPVAGSVRALVAGSFRGEDIEHGLTSGTCPFCLAHVPLSGKGFVTAHNRGAESVPAPKGKLADRQTVVTDTGARVGDPDAGDRRRGTDVDGLFERGTVPGHDPKTYKPIKDDDGHQVEVPATAANVRAVLEYWKARRPRKQASKDAQTEHVSRYTRMLRAFEGAPVPRYDRGTGTYVSGAARNVPLFEYDTDTDTVAATDEREQRSMAAAHSPEGLQTPHTLCALDPSPVSGVALAASQMVPGPPSYRGRGIEPMAGPVAVSHVDGPAVEVESCEDTRGNSWIDRAGTLAGPLGRERMDRDVVGERPRAHRSRAQAGHHRKKMRRLASKGLVPVKGALKARADGWSRGLPCGHLAGEGCGCA